MTLLTVPVVLTTRILVNTVHHSQLFVMEDNGRQKTGIGESLSILRFHCFSYVRVGEQNVYSFT